MIFCVTSFCEEHNEKEKTKPHPNTKFLRIFQMVGIKNWIKTGSFAFWLL